MAVSFDEVSANLRACLVSCKGGVDIRNVEKDYQMLSGERIPYRQLGFGTLHEFLTAVDGVSIQNLGSVVKVVATPNEKTGHILRLISGQRSAPKKSKKIRSVNTRSAYQPNKFNLQRNHHSNYNRTNNSYNNYSQPQRAAWNPTWSAPKPQASNCSRPMPLFVPLQVQKPKPSPLLINQNDRREAMQELFRQEKTSQFERKIPSPPVPKVPTPPKAKSPPPKKTNLESRLQRLRESMTTPPATPVQSPPVQQTPKPQQVSSAVQTSPPQQFKPPPQREPAVISNDPVSRLNYFAQQNGLTKPEYKVTKVLSKEKDPAGRNIQVFYATVEVNSEKYSSYPQEAINENGAKWIVAETALKALHQKMMEKPNIPTTSDEIAKKQILELVSEHYAGIYEHKMEEFYNQKYGECLPESWFSLVQKIPEVMVEKLKNARIISLRSKSSKNCSAVEQLTCPPEEEYWPVFVMHVAGVKGVWARLTDENSAKFEALANDMVNYYNVNKDDKRAKDIFTGGFYAFYEGGFWHRVRCESFDEETNNASIFFIDHGDRDTVDAQLLCTLTDDFSSLPAQAIKFSLHGLEPLADVQDDMVIQCIEKRLLDNMELYAYVADRTDNVTIANFFQGNDENALNLNEYIFYDILQNCKSPEHYLLTCSLTTSTVSHVTDDAELFLNIHSESYSRFKTLYDKLLESKPDPFLSSKPVTYIDNTKMYFTKKPDGEVWHRAKVLQCQQTEAVVFLIDHGATIEVTTSDLVLVEDLPLILEEYPPQAVKVQLDGVPDKVLRMKLSRFKELVKDEMPTKVIKTAGQNDLTQVKLFIRSENNVPTSINDAIIIEMELDIIEPNNNGNLVKQIINLQTATQKLQLRNNDWPKLHVIGSKDGRVLNPPTIPYNSECFFDVHVALAANPGNFVIQPFERSNRTKFRLMSQELNVECLEKENTGVTFKLEDVKVGTFFAAKHNCHKWCRVYIKNKLSDGTVTIYFCDYGDIQVCKISELLPLEDKFLLVPYQALRAQLEGAKPVNKDWSFEDIFYFKELVNDKNLVSVIKNISLDKITGDAILTLQLIDTSTHVDVYIDKKMIAENHALPV